MAGLARASPWNSGKCHKFRLLAKRPRTQKLAGQLFLNLQIRACLKNRKRRLFSPAGRGAALFI
jgi:hypothetical protein